MAWEKDRNVEDFLVLAENLKSEGQSSRAEAVGYLIQRIQDAERILTAIETLINSKTTLDSLEVQKLMNSQN